ncbi:hypothetical protein D3C71_1403610 [compost metagenome]
MIKTDIGNYGQQRLNNIGAIQTSAKADFNDSDINLILLEIIKSHRYSNFEKRWTDFFYQLAMGIDKINNKFFLT